MTTMSSRLLRDQMEQGKGIPRALFVDPELYRREIESVFQPAWAFVGHVSQLAQPGQYVAVEYGTDSIVVTRTEDGLAGVHNVCRHRGARLLDPGCGQARRLVCPYHSWVYELDGRLRHAPLMPSSFDPEQFPLRPVEVETWQGLVFARLTPGDDPAPATLLGGADELIAPFDIATARVAHTITYDVAANWKLVWENAQECYHCAANHPELLRTFMLAPLRDPDWQLREVHRNDDMRVQFSPLELKEGAVSLTTDGRPASSRPLGQFADGRSAYTAVVHLKPTFAMACCPDYAMVLSERPVAIDRTQVVVSWLVAADAVEGVDFDTANLVKVWDETNKQDWELCERTQLGVRSTYYEPGPLAGDEPAVAAFHEAYAQMLERAGL